MNKPVLSVKNLSAGYGGREVISGITFDIGKGEIVAIVGESGSGKSTLLKSILLMEEQGIVISDGAVEFDNTGESFISTAGQRKFRGGQLGMIFQNPQASFNPIRTYKKQFIETLKSHGRYRKETFDRQVAEIFEKLKLDDHKRILDSCPYEMSGGMNQRIAIALAVLLKPGLLLADEPTSALDVTAQRQVTEELLRIRKYYHTSMLIVTHNIALAIKTADKVGVMKQGKIVEFGIAKEVFEHPQSDYTKGLLKAVPRMEDAGRERTRREGEPFLLLQQVSKEYKTHLQTFQALTRVELQLRPGEILGIVGISGSGKSTLLRQIAGLEKPSEGRIIFHGEDMARGRKKSDYCRMQLIFQNACESFDPRLTIRYSIGETLRNLCGVRSKKERKEQIDCLMEKVGLKPELADRYPNELSGGQCQRAAIARAICVRPEVLLCDEITSALDAYVQADIIKLLLKLAKDFKLAIIMVSHDIALVSNICDRIMVMHEGRCMEAGYVRDFITNPKTDAAKRLLADTV